MMENGGVEVVVERRSSSRFLGKKKPIYAPSKSPKSDEKAPLKKRKLNGYKKSYDVRGMENGTSVSIVERKLEVQGAESSVRMTSATDNGGSEVVALDEMGMSAHARVKDTLRIFNAHYLHFVQEEAKRCKKEEKIGAKVGKKGKLHPEEDNKQSPNSKIQKIGETNLKKKHRSKRPDLKAITKMLGTNTILYPQKKIGHLPGIDVGYQFFSRAEMVVLGFHGHWLNGIDYIGGSNKMILQGGESYILPLAVSIVVSGQYEDDLDNRDEIIYTGQGGHDLLGKKKQLMDQKMLRGNLALKNNCEQGLPVRVTRGHSSSNSYCGKVYTYDGLYKVVEFFAQKGLSGFTVFKYRLSRLEGQPQFTTNQVRFVGRQSTVCLADLQGLVCKDLSGGQEKLPIAVTNVVDDPPLAPDGFIYSKSMQISENVQVPDGAQGCSCKGSCEYSKTCTCAKLNDGDIPYVCSKNGRLVVAKDVVYECGPKCECGPDCINRVSQRDINYRLEVFRTLNKGWAVRSWDIIPSGAPVCEYIGVLKRTDDLDDGTENNYIFEIDCLQTVKGIDGRQRRFGDVSSLSAVIEKHNDKKLESSPEFCIDAGLVGNVARFINHSCQPNLFVQCVLSCHNDIRLARVVLFAADNIPPLEELTYDYNYALDSVIGPDGQIKKVSCFCGAPECRGRLF